MSFARCRLCLESIRDNNFVVLEDFERNMLETLAPRIKLDITLEPKLCDKCAKSLQTSYDFKAFWLQNNENIKKVLILRELYPVPCLASCGICGEIIRDTTEEGDQINWKEMVEKCVPELDVYCGDKISACKRCVEDLKSVYTFIGNVMDVEKKIEDYCSMKDKSMVDLDDIFTFYNVPIDHEEVAEQNESREIVNEGEIVAESNNNESQPKNLTRHKRRKTKLSNQYQCDQCSYVSKHKSALNSHLMRHKDPTETTMFKCSECDHETKRKGDLQAHLIVHKDYSELKTFKCDQCPYQARRKSDLQHHLFSHLPKNFKCEHCLFVTNNPVYLNKIHALKHKDKSELTMHKCTECTYENYNKTLLKKHALVHKSKAEVPTYKCNWCEFETRSKANIRHHMDLHKCPSQIRMYECYHCGYKSRRKGHLKDHIKMHTNQREETYYCANCKFETKRKSSLRKHMLSHRALSQKWYHCKLCSFKSSRKWSVKRHILRRHKKKKE